MYRYHFSYRDSSVADKFLRGHNVFLEQDNLKAAIDKFNEEKPGMEILGHLKTNATQEK